MHDRPVASWPAIRLFAAAASFSGAVLFGITSCADQNPVAPSPHAALNPSPSRGMDRISRRDPGDAEYFVILNDTVRDRDAFADTVVRRFHVRIGWIYRNVLNGFTVHHLSDSTVAQLGRWPGL